MVFGAFAEEIVFRGLLLPNFLRRFGLHRGIFLTGIAWAAVHFRSDSYSGLSVDGVLIHLANRVFLCLALNYVFAWMTLRWSSIIPAAIAHSTWNILVSMQQNTSELWIGNAHSHFGLSSRTSFSASGQSPEKKPQQVPGPMQTLNPLPDLTSLQQRWDKRQRYAVAARYNVTGGRAG